MNLLTQKVLSCQKGEVDFEEIYNEILIIAYYYPIMYLGWRENICAEFVLDFEPKIERMVYGFKYRNIEFTTYLSNSLKWHGKTIQRKKKIVTRYGQVVFNEYISENPDRLYSVEENPGGDLRAAETELQTIIRLVQSLPTGKKTSNTRAFVIYLFSCCEDLNEEDLFCLSKYLSIDLNDLLPRLAMVREDLMKTKERRAFCLKRINTLHCSLETIKTSLEEPLKRGVSKHLKKKLAIKEGMLERARENFSRLSLTPSITTLSKAFDMPRGSVFTSISRVRNLIETLYENPQLLYSSKYENRNEPKQLNEQPEQLSHQRDILCQRESP